MRCAHLQRFQGRKVGPRWSRAHRKCPDRTGLSNLSSAGPQLRRTRRPDKGRCRAASQGWRRRRRRPVGSRSVPRCRARKTRPQDKQRQSASSSREGSTSRLRKARCTAACRGRWLRRRCPRGTASSRGSSSWPGSSRQANRGRCRRASAGPSSSRRCPAGTQRRSRLSSPQGTKSQARTRLSKRLWQGRATSRICLEGTLAPTSSLSPRGNSARCCRGQSKPALRAQGRTQMSRPGMASAQCFQKGRRHRPCRASSRSSR